MFRAILVVLLLICAGCLSSKFEYDHDDIVKYLKKNPGVPADIEKALHEGRLEVGMNKDEVELCWGPPTEVRKTEPPDVIKTIWKYSKSDNSWKSLPSSPHWERQIPMYTATFGANERLKTWHVYGQEKTPSQVSPKKRNNRKKSSKKPTRYTTKRPDDIKWATNDDVSNWPSFEITSILVGGASKSVVINGRPMDEGDRILGMKILKIYPEGVKIQYGQEILYLRKGTTTR